MTNQSEEKVLAALYLSLKGPKKKREDWISIAKKCKKLAKMYGSYKEVAEKLGVSYQLVRSIMSLLQLPREVQRLVKEGKILYDAAQRINTVKGKKKKQIEVARAIAGLTSHEQREIIQYAKKYPNSSLANYKKRLAAPAVEHEKIHVAIIPLRQKMFGLLQRESTQKKISLESVILDIIDEWMKRREKRNK